MGVRLICGEEELEHLILGSMLRKEGHTLLKLGANNMGNPPPQLAEVTRQKLYALLYGSSSKGKQNNNNNNAGLK